VSPEIYDHEGKPGAATIGGEHDLGPAESSSQASYRDRAPGEDVAHDAAPATDIPAVTGEEADEPSSPEQETWAGSRLEPYSVGDPGRAALEVTPALPESPHDPADTQLDGGVHGPFVIRAASMRGTSHRYSGMPRQDEYALCTCGQDWLIAAVADGVSAGELSHVAAALAARGAAGFIRDRLADSPSLESLPWMDMLGEVAGRIVLHGQRRLSSEESAVTLTAADVARSMATTLVVLVVEMTPQVDGQRRGSVLSLGDTSVFQLGADGAWEPVTSVKNAGAAVSTSATAALPYLPSYAVEPIPVVIGSGEGLFVMTDGVGDPLGTGTGVVGDFLASAWREPPDLLSFGAQVGFARRSYDDDRTVVGIWANR